MGEFLQSTIVPAFMRFVNTRGVRAIKDGMMFSMPAIMVGAVYLLLFQLPVESLANFVASTGIVPFLSHGYTSTFAITAMITTVGIAYAWAKNDGWEPLSAGIISMMVFLILIPDYVPAGLFDAEGNEVATLAGLDKTWLGGQGMIGAIIAGLLTGLIYSWFMKKDITIKMPDGVPDGVAAAFTGLIPAATICTGAVVVYALCSVIAGQTPIELIYTFLQAPLQGITDSLGGVIIFTALIPLFWFFGVHGATVVGAVMGPINSANMLENQALVERLMNSGMSRNEAVAAMAENGGHILSEPFMNTFNAITGSGITIGLVVFMLVFAKSAQMKQVGKLGIGAGIFNINEPVLFGTPIVMNPKLLVPFVLAPLFGVTGAYILTMIGFMPYTTGISVPWTTPPILSGFLNVGWQGALWQAVELVASFFIYLPFARSVDQEYLATEAESEQA
ncbi:MAG: PTS sugar transporter subunit IIC [Atopobiaceae bacterium]|nr:PTS sugar transporter subunit IIC [Atopobiaceae bacterium]